MSVDDLRELKGFKPEKVRLLAERELSLMLEGNIDFSRMPDQPYDPRKEKRLLRVRSIRLTESMSPKLMALSREVRRVMRLDKPIEIYQSAGLEEGNAHAVYLDDAMAIEMIGRWIMSLDAQDIDERAMLAILGHEVGHHLCHHPHTMYGSIYQRAQTIHVTTTVLGETARAHRLAAELTADRFGLLACQDLDAVLRLEMITAAGLQTSALSWDTRSYLDDACDAMEELYREGETAMGMNHPEHNLRAYASWLYFESDAYCALTGREPGPDARTIAEVDDVLSQLLGVERLRRRRPDEPKPRTVRRRGFGGAPGPTPSGGAPWASGEKSSEASRPGQPDKPDTPDKPDKPDRKPEMPKIPMTREEKLRDMGSKAATVLGKASQKVKPGLSKVTKSAGAGVGRLLGRRPGSPLDEEPADDFDDSFDPLADDEDELMGRFAALEQKVGSGGLDDFDASGSDDDLDALKRQLGKSEAPSRPKPKAPKPDDDLDDDDVMARFAELERQVKKGR